MYLLDRRRFLASSAASLLAAPFCKLLSRPAHAGVETGSAKRLLVIFTPNGTVHEHWRPQGGERDFSFATGSVLEPLSAYRDELIVVDDMDFLDTACGHEAMPAMLTANGATSIDQYIAAAIGSDTRFQSLELGVQTSAWGAGMYTRMSYLDGAYVPPDDDPLSAWARLFGDLGDPSLQARRQSVLDLAAAELSDLRGRLGSAEQTRLDIHLESLRAVERSLEDSGSCEDPSAPSLSSYLDNDAFPDVAEAQLALAVQALACGATRVASVQLSHSISETVFTWLGETDHHHNLSHEDDSSTAGVASFINCERWYAERIADTLDRLLQLEDPETGEPMLDTTVVLWVKEMGDGRLHSCSDVPWVIAGNAGGFFNTGRYLSLGGAGHDGLLTSVCNAFGLSNTSFGTGSSPALEVLR